MQFEESMVPTTIEQDRQKNQTRSKEILQGIARNKLGVNERNDPQNGDAHRQPGLFATEVPIQGNQNCKSQENGNETYCIGFVIVDFGTTTHHYHTGIAKGTEGAFGKNGHKEGQQERHALPFALFFLPLTPTRLDLGGQWWRHGSDAWLRLYNTCER